MTHSQIQFDTDAGPAAIQFDEAGITRVFLPFDSAFPSYAGSFPVPLPQAVAHAIDKMKDHFSGRVQWFDDIPLPQDQGDDFRSKVYYWLRKTPPGHLTTYKRLATRAGNPNASRAVARFMAENPVPLLIPCHRVVRSDGSMGGFSAAGGVATKARLLHMEGAYPRFERDQKPFASLFETDAMAIALASLADKDERFASMTQAHPPAVMPQRFSGNPFGAIVESVVYQQLAGKAALAIFRRLLADVEVLKPEVLMQAGEEGLRGCGLSRSKARTILTVAEAFSNGELNARQFANPSLEALRSLLLPVKGIGPWTVDMVAIFHLGLPDVFPAGDLGVRSAIARLSGRKTVEPDTALRFASAFRPFRTALTWALWQSLGTTVIGTE